MSINLNSQVTVTLTPRGVKIVRVANMEYRKQMISLGIEASDAYNVESDQLTDTFWEIIQLFAPYCEIGMECPFTNLALKSKSQP